MKIDLHVHVVGNGIGGTGCWYNPRGWTRLGEPLMLRAFGLPSSALRNDLDALYAQRLLRYVQSSSLDAVVILAQDEPHDVSGKKLDEEGSFYVPNRYVLDLAKEHPKFLAGVSIHPARPDALDELESCLADGAALLKCLPNCQNIDWNDRHYTQFLERMAEAGLPLLAHTGGERTLPVVNKDLADPRVLTRALEIGVTCIAAHCGTSSGWFDRDYFEIFAGLADRFHNLYGDNSAFSVPTRRVLASYIQRCTIGSLAGRVLHGSDVPVPVLGHAAYLRGCVSRQAFRRCQQESNPLERDYQLKRAMGFPESSFTQASKRLRISRRAAAPNTTSTLSAADVGPAPITI